MRDLTPAPLENWLRDYYFEAEIDISSSGVEPYSFGELRTLVGIGDDELDRVVLQDGYSSGAPSLRAAIAERWSDGDPSRVLTAHGSGEAIFLVLAVLLRPGDEVVVVEPGYHSLLELARSFGCPLRPWRLSFDDGYQVDIAELTELISPSTRAVIVNFPHNPTGTTVSEPEMTQLLDAADRVGAYVLWDAAFADLTYDADPLPDIASLYERGISIGTFSKSFGLPGLRFGWALMPPEVADGCIKYKDYTTLHVSPLVELIACRSVERADVLQRPRLERARLNRSIVAEWADSHADVVSMVPAQGGVTVFPRLTGLATTSPLCATLFKEHGVLVIPGACFGCPEHIRLGFGGPTEQLVEGLDVLATALLAEGG